jgi:hypothetical protein
MKTRRRVVERDALRLSKPKPSTPVPSSPGPRTAAGGQPEEPNRPPYFAYDRPVPRAKRPPTDFELLRAIYVRHRNEYARAGRPGSEVMLPIDIPAIASDLRVDVNSIFGRLYYHLDPLYGEENEEGARKAFFMPVPGDDPDRVNFPLLEAVYAGLWQQRRRDLWTFWIAVTSAGIAIGSLVVSIATA